MAVRWLHPESERRLAAILSADVAGYSRLMAADEDAIVANRADRRSLLGLVITVRPGTDQRGGGPIYRIELPGAL